MAVVDAILARCIGNELPVGFVRIVPCDGPSMEHAELLGQDVLSWASAGELGAAGLYPLGTNRRSWRFNWFGITVIDVSGERVISATSDLLASGLFRVVVIDPFDAVGPESEKWGGLDRLAWLRQTLPGLRATVQKAKATVFLICYQSGGNRVLSVWSSLSIKLHRNRRGIVVSVEGRDSIPGNAPFLLSDFERWTG